MSSRVRKLTAELRVSDLIRPLLVAVVSVIVVDIFTNSLDPFIDEYHWDFLYYIDMAEHGFDGEYGGVAPFAYRYGSTLPAYLLHAWFGLSVHASFKMIAYVGAVSTLVLVYAFIKYLGFSRRSALLCMLVVVLARSQVKFLLFDPYRPDHLAYPLMVLAIILLLEKRWWPALLISVAGLQIREFLIIPILIIFVYLLREIFVSQGLERRNGVLKLTAMAVIVGLAMAIPRLLIEVEHNQQHIDPINKPETISFLIADPTNIRKNINLWLSFWSFILPSLLMVTPERARSAWQESHKRWVWVLYTLLVVVMAVYSGTDYYRFMTYLFLPQAVFLAHMFESRPYVVEIVYMFVVVVLINQTFAPFPIWDFGQYIDGFGGWSVRVNLATVRKALYIAGAVASAAALRTIVANRRLMFR